MGFGDFDVQFQDMDILSFLIHEENEDVLLQTIDLDLGFLNSENEDQKLVSTVTEADIDNSAQIENVSSCLTYIIQNRYRIKYKTIPIKH